MPPVAISYGTRRHFPHRRAPSKWVNCPAPSPLSHILDLGGRLYRLLLVPWLVSLVACADGRSSAAIANRAAAIAQPSTSDSAFATLVERLSEPGGYFDTDNLISNERSYLHVVGRLREMGVEGGAYIGVGPDQNFSYIAHVRPAVAFIIDIRRDNLLEHLMFKALFSLSRSRVEYLSLLHGRPAPDDPTAWRERGIEEIIEYIDSRPADLAYTREALARVAERAERFGLPISAEDVETIRRFHSQFIRQGMDLRFRSHGRRPRSYYPTYRQLILETDLDGRRASYLADEARFQFVRSLQEKNLVVPVVGDLAGSHALTAIGAEVDARGLVVSCFYTSNVEDYLLRGRTFDRYVRNVSRLPHDSKSVIVRSFFGRGFGYIHPQSVPGYHSVQLLQPIETLLEHQAREAYRSYLDLVSRNTIEAH